MKIVVSACLLGENCKYNGKSNLNEKVLLLEKKYQLIPICPEVFGGLGIPRIPSEILNDKVFNQEGVDVTSCYLLGAKKALDILKENDVKVAVLKARSPACGKGKVYDGTFSHKLIDSDGITVRLFKENGVTIYTEDEIDKLL